MYGVQKEFSISVIIPGLAGRYGYTVLCGKDAVASDKTLMREEKGKLAMKKKRT